MTLVVLTLSACANASAESCAAGLTTNPVKFESALTYDDLESKSNPAVHVHINGKLVKMQVDSGSNLHSLWDRSLIDDSPSLKSMKLDASSGSTDARLAKATLADAHGNSFRQEFALFGDSALAQDGFSGILSPQAIAGLDAAVIDFDRNCFFISAPFSVSAHEHLHVARGFAIQNPHDVMAVSADLDGHIIPVLIDSGASSTMIQASLIESNPKGKESPQLMDLLKNEVLRGDHMRLVDLKINGVVFKSLPVIPRLATDEEGVANFGYIGMDILKERVVYYDGAKREFNLLTRLKFDKPLGDRTLED